MRKWHVALIIINNTTITITIAITTTITFFFFNHTAGMVQLVSAQERTIVVPGHLK